MTKQEQIKAIIYKHTYHGGTHGVPLTIDVESIAIEIESELSDLKQQLAEYDKGTILNGIKEYNGSGWICPRCQKVHSWLSMTCDCDPNTITSTTY
jgi:hypothetical protein